MALSNWDTLAFGPDGEAIPGDFELRDGAVLEIYKNWIYIRHPNAWFEGSGFTGDVVMQIDSGDIRYAGCQIVVARHPKQHSCFVFVEDRDYSAKTSRYFAGIGCSAYLSTVEWMERNDPELLASLEGTHVLPEGWRDMEYMEGSSHFDGESWEVVSFIKDDGIFDVKLYPYDDRPDTYVGVLPETLEAFLEWLERTVAENTFGDEAKEWLAKVKGAKPLRYNQGDAFFASHLGRDIPSTSVGQKPSPTAMSVILDHMAEEESDDS